MLVTYPVTLVLFQPKQLLLTDMSDAELLAISQACLRENITLYPDTEFANTAPGVYQFTNYEPNRFGFCVPEKVTAIFKGHQVRIQR